MPHPLRLAVPLMIGACGGDPAVTLSVSALADTPMSPGIAEKVNTQLQRPLEACFREVRAQDSAAHGTVTVTGSGSHGIMSLNAEQADAPPTLVSCVTSLLETQKVQRPLVDGDGITGFRLVVTFGD